MATGLDAYREVWLVDCESSAPPGERPNPACLVAQEFRTGQTLRLGHEDLRGGREPLYPTGPDALFVAYGAGAELGCHLALNWPLPARVLDLQAEFRCRTTGLAPPHGDELLGALTWYGLDPLGEPAETSCRLMFSGREPRTAGEREAIFSGCEGGVRSLGRLLSAMAPALDLPRALLRGRYMRAVARMEGAGVPIDVPFLARVRAGWRSIRDRLTRDVDQHFGVFDGGMFRADRWEAWLARNRVPWPRLESGRPAMDEETFREMARSHPDVAPMRELPVSLAQLQPSELTVGSDGRNRTPLCPFASKTGRNQPSSMRFIFGPATWLRGLIRPGPGRAVAYVDWEQQEFGIAAALSGDPAMMAAYYSGDPYLALAVQAGQAPADATRETHGPIREQFKACVLGVQYGMGEAGLARRLGQPAALARSLLQLHRETYPHFWAWSDGAENHAILLGWLRTVFGWTIRVGAEANPRSLRNFPCQANGAEMLRLACTLATERGIVVCARSMMPCWSRGRLRRLTT